MSDAFDALLQYDTLEAETVPHAPFHAPDMERKPFADAASALRFIEAGKATVTLVSLKTGTRFTYKITQSDDGNCYFVGLLNGSDNESNYKYIGRISRGIFWAGRKNPRPGDINRDAPSVRAFAWSYRSILQGNLPDSLEIWHEGHCGRCGHILTVPASIASGFGPECIKHM